ncbi:MAG: hypothetical protein KAR06_09155, partial [Deltaproteobacteria bacterium]|nr:hypothetical protein [Deltaproteobacteria bacterium]
ILEGLWEGDYQEMDDAQFFYGLQNPSGDCVVELYGKIRYDEGKEVSRDSWIRGVDPETHEVLWKNEDTGLWRMGIDQGITWADYGFTYYFGVDTRVKFAKDKKVFLMTNLRYDDKDETGSTHSTNNPVYKVKGFSCETGYINDIFVYESKESKPISPMAIISDDGSRVVYANLKEIVVYDNELGRVLWSQKDEGQLVIGGFHMSDDRKYLLVLRESPSNVKNEGCCGRFQLHDMESGEVIWSKSVTMDLGDKDYYPDYDVGRLISGDLSSDGAVAIIYFGPHEARSSLLVNKRGEHLMVADTFEILEYKGRLLLEGKRFYDISEFVKEQGGPFPTDR